VARATVTDKERRWNPSLVRRIEVSFWTAPLLEGGDLIHSEIRRIGPADWRALQVGDQVEVVYLPHDPQRVDLAASLSASSLAPAERYAFGLGVLLAGGLFVTITARRRGFPLR